MVFLVSIFLVIDVMMRPRNPLGFRMERRTEREVKCGDDGGFWSWLIYVVCTTKAEDVWPNQALVRCPRWKVVYTKIGRRTQSRAPVEGP
jgi:hypothetical protein